MKVLFVLVLLFSFEAVQSQDFKNGVRQGIIKVKFAASMSDKLSAVKVSARSGSLTTGIDRFDATAKAASASNMYRLFPYDAMNESKMRKHGLHLWYVVEIDNALDPRIAASQFKQLTEVETAEVDREKSIAPYQVEEYKPQATTFFTSPFNDPYLKDQWHYNNVGQSGYADADINLFEAWQSTTGAADIIVSVHDEGVDVKHEDLKENIWVNADEIPNNGVDDDNNGYIDDINGFNFAKNKGVVDAQHHGTHVAGTIAAVNNNGKGVCGVAGGNGSGNGVKVMSLQILGGGLIERSYVYAANNGAVISQNSWGYTTEGYFDQSVLDAIKYFIAEAGSYEGSPMRGGLVIFAAGNSNSDSNWYPARYEPILSVAAIGPEWKKAAYSNYGPWVEVSAPGGDQINYPGINGVLSTIPGNKYAYLQGTSMACPHVSGIAALALANRTKQLTAQELWSRLVTGVISIDEQNAGYIGKLGSGAIDAALAIKADKKIAPHQILDLSIEGIAQEFATLSWTVPTDEDDTQPVEFDLYYSTSPINATNVQLATKVVVKNTLTEGAKFNYEVDGLLGLTTYYFTVSSKDRWGNTSSLSNGASASTNAGPAIAVNPTSLQIDVDASKSATGSTTFDIMNDAVGILRWKAFMRHRSSTTAFNASSIQYPMVPASTAPGNIGRINIKTRRTLASNTTTSSFVPLEKKLSEYPTNLVGETNTTFPNSAAGRFYVNEEEGFNLTNVSMYLKHDPSNGPVVVEIYQGTQPIKQNLVYAQEYTSPTKDEIWANIVLDEQIYFERGSTFWIAFHIPSGNLFPLGISYEVESTSSTNCFFSVNTGNTWQPLDEALNDKNFAWVMSAGSYNQFLGTYLTLDPGEGDVNGKSATTVSLSAEASQLINGSYSANIVIASNDGKQKELRIPVSVNFTGQRANIKHVDIANFGPVFVGEEVLLDIVLDNQGYGNMSDVSYHVDGSDFSIVSSNGFLPAKEKTILTIAFKPTSPGNKNAVVHFSNDTYDYDISLFGIGAETSKISVTPEVQVIKNLTIGQTVHAKIQIQNTGAFPLKYFVPGFDAKGISENWPTSYHKYGYKIRTNRTGESNPIGYGFVDISKTGTDITSKLIKDNTYFTVDMGFSFPYYGRNLNTIYIAQKGFTTFDNTIRPINTPILNSAYSPAGYISPIGTFLTYITEGKIFYKRETDRLIIQYDNVTDGYAGHLTAQMVLFANGDIRFYYEDMGYPEWAQPYLNILIEDIEKTDGILIHNYEKPIELHSGLAIGLDYPGPNIISSVTNGSGILAPGASTSLDIDLNTASLSEGVLNRYINIVNNDPLNKQKIALIQLNIDHGGTAKPVLSTNDISFGDVFKGAAPTRELSIKNEGTATAQITSMKTAKGAFKIFGDATSFIKPGLFNSWRIQLPGTTLGVVTDVLTVTYKDGTSQTVHLSGTVISPPDVVVDLSPVNENLAYGEQKEIPLSVKNTGLANLEFAATGEEWVYYTAEETAASYSYEIQKENTGGIYQWIDIRKTGTQLPFVTDLDDITQYWRNLSLPFSFQYFGKDYAKIKIGDNGVISFEEAPPMMEFSDSIPSKDYEGAYIMPYWSFASFNTTLFKKEDVGIFYQFYEDKVVITWSYLINHFGGMGDPVSAQVILYKNGAMKFQYKVEETGVDLTSQSTLIGLQENSSSGIMISDRLALDFGQNLAFNIIPVKKFIIAPGASLNGKIVLDGTNTYSGNYESLVTINTNVPSKEILHKPISLTITGKAELSTPATVNFGERIIAVEDNLPVAYPLDVRIKNTGTTPVDLSWIKSASEGASPFSLQLYVLVDGWSGRSWEWVDASSIFSEWNTTNPVFQIMPGDTLAARAVFFPLETGDFQEQITITSSLGDKVINLNGTGIGAPTLSISKDLVEVNLNTQADITSRTVEFNNNDGKSALTYSMTIEYDRAVANRTNEVFGTQSYSFVKQQPTLVESGITLNDSYIRTIKYTDRTTPDSHVGTGGTEPFTLATKFNAGNKGFNLSHIETWFRAEGLAEGDIDVEVRAGSSITEATTLMTTSVHFTRSGDDQKGGWQQLPLEHSVFIYPNEDFYIILTYPFEINYPQGTVKNQPTIPGRYLYASAGSWFDIQTEDGFNTSGWLMFAAEQSPLESSWINITSSANGTLAVGESSSLQLSFVGAMASPGDQKANVVITTNDPAQHRVVIPIKLHMNQSPEFGDVPDEVKLNEQDTLVIQIAVRDPENNNILTDTDTSIDFISTKFNNGILQIKFTPQYGDAGSYTAKVIVQDQFGASNNTLLRVVVNHTNQAPKYIGQEKGILVDETKSLLEFKIKDFFEDPDLDAITFSAASTDTTLAQVFSSQEKFLLQVRKPGNAAIQFIVSDSHGASTTKVVPLSVNVVLGTSPQLIEQQVKIFPNPADDKLTIQFGETRVTTKRVALIDVQGKTLIDNITEDDLLQMNVNELAAGLYLLKITVGNHAVVKKIIIQ